MFILKSHQQHVTMYRAFVIWRFRTGVTIPPSLRQSISLTEFMVSFCQPLPRIMCQGHLKFWKVWREAMPCALQAKLACERDKKAVHCTSTLLVAIPLPIGIIFSAYALEKWLQMYWTKK
jgi:hypothetical protein